MSIAERIDNNKARNARKTISFEVNKEVNNLINSVGSALDERYYFLLPLSLLSSPPSSPSPHPLLPAPSPLTPFHK
jgi:hypothetical protein